jgi:exportin-1
MRILKLLSEEVFDFSKDSMTAAKIKMMKESLHEEFSQVFQLCELVLGAATKTSLIIGTLETLQRFLSWISLPYIFETNLIPGLIAKFLPQPKFRYTTTCSSLCYPYTNILFVCHLTYSKSCDIGLSY